jgi:hypothetical protein
MRAQTFHKFIIEKPVCREALLTLAPVAQLERATDFESVGCVFKSRQARSHKVEISHYRKDIQTDGLTIRRVP